jgi:hypothetical protein
MSIEPERSGQGVGDIRDVVYVAGAVRLRARRHRTGRRLNDALGVEGRPYLLIDRRWGTADRWLGIPVEWRQISGARAMIETDLDDLSVEPSEGTHFFQNLTSFGIGYFTVNQRTGGGFVDFAWLDSQPAERETTHLRHVHLTRPLDLRLDGHSRRGVILK